MEEIGESKTLRKAQKEIKDLENADGSEKELKN